MQVRYVQAYPEFCRATFDLAPDNFLTICTELQKAYGKVSPLASVALYLPRACHIQASPVTAGVMAFTLHLGHPDCLTAMSSQMTGCTCAEPSCACMQPADRRYILLYLWMAREGGGMVPSKPIMSSAKRLRVT